MTEITLKSLAERENARYIACSEKHDKHETSIDELWAAVNTIRNRPPNWATFAMILMSGAIGSLSTFTVTLLS